MRKAAEGGSQYYSKRCHGCGLVRLCRADRQRAGDVPRDGKGTGLIAARIKGGRKVDAELSAILESCPPEARDQFKFNVGKIGNGNLHQMNFGKGLPDNMKRVLDADKLLFLLTP